VPQRRSALAVMCSTPKSNSSSAGSSGMKRVQFFSTTEDSDESAILGSAERRIVESGTDQIDQVGRTTDFLEGVANVETTNSSLRSSESNGKRSRTLAECDEELSGKEILERKKKRRRHRKKKKKDANDDDYTVENMDIETSEAESPCSTTSGGQLSSSNGIPKTSVSPTQEKAKGSRRRVMSSSDDDEANTKVLNNNSKSKSKSVKQTNSDSGKSTIEATLGKTSNNTQVKDESGVFLTPSSILIASRSKKSVRIASEQISNGKRQDTPILPRVLKNPGVNIEAVRRSLSMKLAKEEEATDVKNMNVSWEKESPSTTTTEDSEIGKKLNGSKTTDDDETEKLQALPEVTDVATIKVGDIIAFKVKQVKHHNLNNYALFGCMCLCVLICLILMNSTGSRIERRLCSGCVIIQNSSRN